MVCDHFVRSEIEFELYKTSAKQIFHMPQAYIIPHSGISCAESVYHCALIGSVRLSGRRLIQQNYNKHLRSRYFMYRRYISHRAAIFHALKAHFTACTGMPCPVGD